MQLRSHAYVAPAPEGRDPLSLDSLRPPDLMLFAAVAALVGIGLMMIFSASSATAYAAHHDTAFYLKRQLMWLAVALVAAFGAYRCDYRKLRRLAGPALCFAFITVIAVLVPHVGLVSGGARRWIGIGPLSFQPSEFAKLALVIYLAAALTTKGERVRAFAGGIFPLLLVSGLLAVCVLKEPDMGTASLLLFVALAMLFVAGARLPHLLATVLVMVPGATLSVVTSKYKLARVLAFVDPFKDRQDTGYHIVQSLYALGSGGAMGLGLGASRQKFSYLPEQYTDFIFAILGEELGLVGTLAVIALFVLFTQRAIRIALGAPDRFGFLLAMGCTFAIVIQAFINIGVVTSSWPVTGVPLPFVSFGGSSLIVSLVCVALLLNIGRHRGERRAR